MFLDLTHGITETKDYYAWKFPGGEIHFKLKKEFADAMQESDNNTHLHVNVRLNNSDNIMFLGIVLGTLAKEFDNKVNVFIPYFPYQQADRDFGTDESFSLITMAKVLNSFERNCYTVYDPHSDVTPALLAYMGDTHTVDNSEHVKHVISRIGEMRGSDWNSIDNLIILSPDAGAYKKIFKLADKIGFKGQIECANKFRPSNGGEPQIRLSTNDFSGKDILVIDDICIGGRTFAVLADELKGKNIGNLYLAISHGIFSNGYIHLESRYKHLFTTNSIQEAFDYKYLCKNIDVYDII
jgi:ribose-phosphate pyrophosphokinase